MLPAYVSTRQDSARQALEANTKMSFKAHRSAPLELLALFVSTMIFYSSELSRVENEAQFYYYG